MDIGSLYKSISEFSDEELREHIRNIRNLRRQFKKVKVKVSQKKPKLKGKKSKQKKLTIKPDLTQLSAIEKQALLQKLLKIKGKKNGEK